jgi:hypothetical protein
MTPTVYCGDVMLHKEPELRTPDVRPVKGIMLVVFNPAAFTGKFVLAAIAALGIANTIATIAMAANVRA